MFVSPAAGSISTLDMCHSNSKPNWAAGLHARVAGRPAPLNDSITKWRTNGLSFGNVPLSTEKRKRGFALGHQLSDNGSVYHSDCVPGGCRQLGAARTTQEPSTVYPLKHQWCPIVHQWCADNMKCPLSLRRRVASHPHRSLMLMWSKPATSASKRAIPPLVRAKNLSQQKNRGLNLPNQIFRWRSGPDRRLEGSINSCVWGVSGFAASTEWGCTRVALWRVAGLEISFDP